MTSVPIALTIAGSDPSGGAGVQADLKTFHQHGVYGTSVLTLLTVQSTQGVTRVEVMSAELVVAQLRHLLADLTPGAAKTGALGSAGVVEAVASEAKRFAFPLVVDPVMISKHGHALLDASAVRAVKEQLVPVATLITPNAHEAAALTGRTVETLEQAKDAARALRDAGAQAVLLKGGHLSTATAVDVLLAGSDMHVLDAERISTTQTHGTGCTASSAIVANMARGLSLHESVSRAKRWLTEAIRTAPGVGKGVGPVNHFAPVRD